MSATSGSGSASEPTRSSKTPEADRIRDAIDKASMPRGADSGRPSLRVAERASAYKASAGTIARLLADAETRMDKFEPQAAVRLLELADR